MQTAAWSWAVQRRSSARGRRGRRGPGTSAWGVPSVLGSFPPGCPGCAVLGILSSHDSVLCRARRSGQRQGAFPPGHPLPQLSKKPQQRPGVSPRPGWWQEQSRGSPPVQPTCAAPRRPAPEDMCLSSGLSHKNEDIAGMDGASRTTFRPRGGRRQLRSHRSCQG